MAEFAPETLEALVRKHRPDVSEIIGVERIATGHFNASYFVQTTEEELVLRIAPPRNAVFVFYERDMMRQEPEIHALLLARTSIPVPRIYAYDDSRELIDRDYLLMERLPGQPLSQSPATNRHAILRQLGRFLAEAHAITADQYGYLGAHHPMEPHAQWMTAFKQMWNKLVDDCVMVGHYSGEDAAMFRRLLDAHVSIFDRPAPASLLHMDVWDQNILVDGSRVTGLVDWDRALWGDPEIEFAVLDYCAISEPAFWEGYGRPRDISPEAQLRQVFYLLYEIQKYIVIYQGRDADAVTARRYKDEVMRIVSRAFA